MASYYLAVPPLSEFALHVRGPHPPVEDEKADEDGVREALWRLGGADGLLPYLEGPEF
jgi:hypothetical protein